LGFAGWPVNSQLAATLLDISCFSLLCNSLSEQIVQAYSKPFINQKRKKYTTGKSEDG